MPRLDPGIHDLAPKGKENVDTRDEPGVYVGTSTGQVFASTDEGDSWSEIASYLPSITSVEVAVVEA